MCLIAITNVVFYDNVVWNKTKLWKSKLKILKFNICDFNIYKNKMCYNVM